jgi:hypothetical protein
MTTDGDQDVMRNQVPPPLDFGGEVYHAFGWLPENKRLNDEIYKRAVARAAQKDGTGRAV